MGPGVFGRAKLGGNSNSHGKGMIMDYYDIVR